MPGEREPHPATSDIMGLRNPAAGPAQRQFRGDAGMVQMPAASGTSPDPDR